VVIEAEELYSEVLRTALADNILSDEEKLLLETLRDKLDISIEKHEDLKNSFMPRRMKCSDDPTVFEYEPSLRIEDIDEKKRPRRGVVKKVLINFRPGSTRMDVMSERRINNIYNELSRLPRTEIEISGHTDDRSSKETDERKRRTLNKHLSFERAKVVRDILVKRGLPIELMVIKGCGEEKPIADNDTSAGRRKNQRVEVRFLSN